MFFAQKLCLLQGQAKTLRWCHVAAAAAAVFGHDIHKVDVYQDRFLVVRTQGTIMLGDMERCKLSELPWESDLTERFFFDSGKVCSASQLLDTSRAPAARTI